MGLQQKIRDAIPNPVSWFTGRPVEKLKKKGRYSLYLYAKRHKEAKKKDDILFYVGIISWLVLPIIGAIYGIPWLNTNTSVYVFLLFAIFPIFLGFWEEIQLAKKLTVTLKVITVDPENNYPITMILRGVDWGSPLSTPEKLLDVIKKIGAKLKTPIGMTLEKAKELIAQADEKGMKLHYMMTKEDDIPALVMFPDVPDKVLKPREERVRLSYGYGKVRHATMYVLECAPISTSITFKDTIIDVEYPLFIPFFTQLDIDNWLADGNWFVPSRVLEEVASYVKRNVDNSSNARTFTTLKKERDSAEQGYNYLLTLKQYEDVKDSVENDVMGAYTPKRAPTETTTLLLVGIIIGITIGWALSFLGWF